MPCHSPSGLQGSAPGVLFLWQDEMPLSQPRFVTATHQTLTTANLPAQDIVKE